MKKKYLDLLYTGKPLPEKKQNNTIKKVNMTPTEHAEQCAFHQWLQYRNIDHAAIPNANALSALNRTMAMHVVNKLKAEGMSSGFPDLCIFTKRKILFIELKRIKGSTTSDYQKDWLEIINSYDYAVGVICYGYEEAILEVEKWIE